MNDEWEVEPWAMDDVISLGKQCIGVVGHYRSINHAPLSLPIHRPHYYCLHHLSITRFDIRTQNSIGARLIKSLTSNSELPGERKTAYRTVTEPN